MFKIIATFLFLVPLAVQAMEKEIMQISEEEAKNLIQELLTLKYKDLTERIRQMPTQTADLIKVTFDKFYSFSLQADLLHVLNHTQPIIQLALSADGTVALTETSDEVRAYHLNESPRTFQILGGNPDIWCTVALSADGSTSATVSKEGIVTVRNLTQFPANSVNLISLTLCTKLL